MPTFFITPPVLFVMNIVPAVFVVVPGDYRIEPAYFENQGDYDLKGMDVNSATAFVAW
jgi:hypothetical protein